MKDDRPRFFAWVSGNGRPSPQLIYDDPRVGCEGLMIIVQRRLTDDEHHLTLEQLAAKYPAPAQNEDAA